MLDKSTILLHYKRKDVQEAMVNSALDREVSIRYADGGFGKRPDVLQYPSDVIELAKRGAASFHVSEERWTNPLLLKPELRKKELDEMRTGWDLVIDIDCPVFEYSRIIAYLIVKAIKRYGISAVSCKFSGNKGFHIGVPYESFPDKVSVKGEMKDIKLLFPDGIRRIAEFLGKKIDSKERGYELTSMILKQDSEEEIAEKTGKPKKELFRTVCNKCETELKKDYRNFDIKMICPHCETENIIKPDIKDNYVACNKCKRIIRIEDMAQEEVCPKCRNKEFVEKFDNSSILEIDSVLISSRHLYRMVYSLHEKSGLASVPVDIDKILEFEREDAKPEGLQVSEIKFLDAAVCKPNEAAKLLQEAFDEDPLIEVDKISFDKEYEVPQSAVPVEFFPPCILRMLNGMQDGKKRALFSMINFLDSLGWSNENIRKLIHDWNEKNEEPLREAYINGQLSHHKNKKKHMLPQNCKSYYEDLRVCFPDMICKKIKNPVNYSHVKVWIKNQEERKKKRGLDNPNLTKEQKEFMMKRKEAEKEFKKKMKEKKDT